ncbi:MAG: SagB/ThcOx family dehydrogenase [Desulfobacterales bacterium]|nr:SagB/ThcOx family dehydrogenase [Desulfobacterales bacterium]
MQTTAMGYHAATSYDRRSLGGHYLDWRNQPSPYKTYPGVAPLGLPEVPEVPAQSLWNLFALQDPGIPPPVFDRSLLARVLALSFSLTAESRQGGQPFYYRSVASAGALYPNEVYLAADGIPDLDPGLFHFEIRRRELAPLRTGHVGRLAAEACGAPDDACGALFLISGIFFRSAWKYRARAFRYVLLDAGHLLVNLLLALNASGVPGALVYDFDDNRLNRFLGLDPRLEACLAGVKVPGRTALPARESPEIADLPPAFIAASRVGAREEVYPEIEAGYRSGLNPGHPEDPPPDMLRKIGPRPERWSALDAPEPSGSETAYPKAVYTRRSRRNFVNTPLESQTFGRLLDLVCRAERGMQKPATDDAATIVLGILVGRVNGVPPGFYLLDPVGRRFGLVTAGDFRSPMATVCLDQDWLTNAGVHFLCMTNLDELDRHWGPRGYRYAMLTAGGIGQALYLGAAALGLGCCGIGALYDGEARGLLGLNAESALLYLVALGVVKRL